MSSRAQRVHCRARPCTGENPDGQRYCGNCGVPLAHTPPIPIEVTPSRLREEIRAALKEQVKDQRLLEVETAAAVVTRVSGWMKLIGIFGAIPLGLLAAILILLGVSSYADFTAQVKEGRKEIEKNLKDTQDRAKLLQAEVEKEYADIARRLADNKMLAARLEELGSQVDQIGKKVGVTFKPSAELTPAVRSQLQRTLDSFQAYLERLGYRTREGRIHVEVSVEIANAYYVPGENKIVISRQFLDDRHVILREYTHHVLCSTVGCDQRNRSRESFESALADYLPCSFLDDPKLGQRMAQALRLPAGYVRNLENTMRLDSTALSKYQVPHQMGEALGGAFWEIRSLIGKDPADRIFFETWISLKESDPQGLDVPELGRRLLTQVQRQGEAHVVPIRKVLLSRGLAL